VNEEYDIVHLSERVGRYLQVAGGEPSQNLLKLIRQELRLELRSALYQAVQRNSAVEARGLKVTVDDVTETINILIRPILKITDVARGYILVIFERINDESGKNEVVLSSDEPVARQLEDELMRLKSQLRVSNEQHEFHAEELKASNEELQAMNEELRSSAEELETSKEELQSINEELRTVNQELKVKVEETTLASNNLYNLINSVDIATIFLDRSCRVAFFTPPVRELFNLIPADYGRPLSDITGKLDYDNLINDAEYVLDKLQSLEREVKTTDGKAYMMRVLPYRTSEDRINGVVVTFINVTSRKTIVEELSASEERLRLILENAKDYAIFTIDADRRISTWNQGAEAIIGYTEKEIVGESADVLFVPEDRQQGAPQKEIERARQTGFAENERWHMRKDGSRFYGSGTVRPLHDDSGTIKGFVKIMRDLTESKRAEEALRESEERLRVTLESAEMGVWDLNVSANTLKWNKQHFLMLGLDPQETEHELSYFLKFIHSEDLESVNSKLDKALREAGVFQAEFRIIRADNKKIRWMYGYGRTISKNEQGAATRMAGVMYDITKRKRLEQQKDEFIGIASHELKTPVTSIKGYAEILLEKLEKFDEKESAVLLRKLIFQVDRLTNLIKDLLDTTRIVEGKLELNLTAFDLNKAIATQLKELQNIYATHAFDFQPGKIKKVSADRERIEEVLSNLISNAVKYSPDRKRVTITTESLPEGVKVSVADEGVGLSAEDQQKIFHRFVRVKNPKIPGSTGMGLGLYISSGIIRQHGGAIDVQSEPGLGSTFSFILPLANSK
jgi:two-component system CheB/CheR fusion protein